jgi:hypothetical protein
MLVHPLLVRRHLWMEVDPVVLGDAMATKTIHNGKARGRRFDAANTALGISLLGCHPYKSRKGLPSVKSCSLPSRSVSDMPGSMPRV